MGQTHPTHKQKVQHLDHQIDAARRWKNQGGSREVEIKHFNHEHPLTLCGNDEICEARCSPCRNKISPKFPSKAQCSACRNKISPKVPSYACYECERFFLHQSCAELPREMVHLFHPKHSLSLFTQASTETERVFACDACSKNTDGYVFQCSECRFKLDVCCASLTPAPPTNNNNNHQQHLGKTHPLILCNKEEKDFSLSCSACDLPLDNCDSIYVCLQCKLLLHEWCVKLPLKIEHPFHPQHPLNLLVQAPSNSGNFRCNACNKIRGGFTFRCSQCDFDLDICCASLMPTTKNNEPREHQIEHFSQKHPLILCNKEEKNFDFSCSGCYLPIIEDSIFVCLQCQLLLHESCTQLQQKIIHPFHPKHPLVLTSDACMCKACVNPAGRLHYHCYECRFTIGIECASLVSTVKYEFHQHPLAFVNMTTEALVCDACNCHFYSPFFRCAEEWCNFNLHVHCIPILPPILEHERHIHPLTFTKSPIKNYLQDEKDENSEYYCSACEDRRRLADPTYYCADCHYVAHVHCLIPEVLPSLEKDSSSACKVVDTKLDTSTNVVEEDFNTMDSSDIIAETEKERLILETDAVENDEKLIPALVEESTLVPQLITSENGKIEVPENPTIAQLDEEIAEFHKQVEAMTEKIRILEARRTDLATSTM